MAIPLKSLPAKSVTDQQPQCWAGRSITTSTQSDPCHQLLLINDWASQGTKAGLFLGDMEVLSGASLTQDPHQPGWNVCSTALRSPSSRPPSEGPDLNRSLMALPAFSGSLPIYPHQGFPQRTSCLTSLSVCFLKDPSRSKVPTSFAASEQSKS